MVRANVDVTDVDDITHVRTRQRNRNRLLAIRVLVLSSSPSQSSPRVVHLTPSRQPVGKSAGS